MGQSLEIALISGAVGVLLGGVMRALIDQYSVFRESKGVARALRAEIASLLEIVKHRKYVQHLDEIIARLSSERYVPTVDDLFGFAVSEDYFTVFSSTAPKIGLLGDAADRIVRVYTTVKALLEDVKFLWEAKRSLASTPGRAALLDLTLDVRRLFTSALQEADQAMQKLDAHSTKRWLGIFP